MVALIGPKPGISKVSTQVPVGSSLPVLAPAGFKNVTFNEYEWYLIFNLYQFADVIKRAKENYDPSEIAKYLIVLAKDFNKWYALERIIDDNKEQTDSRLLVAEATSIVIKEGMRLLGIEALNKM